MIDKENCIHGYYCLRRDSEMTGSAGGTTRTNKQQLPYPRGCHCRGLVQSAPTASRALVLMCCFVIFVSSRAVSATVFSEKARSILVLRKDSSSLQSYDLSRTGSRSSSLHNANLRAISSLRCGASGLLSKNSSQQQKASTTTSLPKLVFNLLKSIVGAGVLGLPAGVARSYGNTSGQGVAIGAAVLWMGLLATVAAFSFYLLGVLCQETVRQQTTSSSEVPISYKECWKHNVGSRTSWIPALSCLMVTGCSVLTYSMILSDTFPNVLSFLPIPRRQQSLFSVTLLILVPLCLQESLGALAPVSMVGILGMIYTAGCMLWRSLDGTYIHPTAGIETNYGVWKTFASTNSVRLVSMLSTAFMAHYNCGRFYSELENNTLERFGLLVSSSYVMAFCLMAVIMVTGYWTFGNGVHSLVLQNYFANDQWMNLSKGAVTVSLLAGYPLAFVGVRDTVLELFVRPFRKVHQTNTAIGSRATSTIATIVLLAIITALACVLQDIGTILAVGGATWGTAVMYVFPALMIWKNPRLKNYRLSALVTGGVGVALAGIGTYRLFRK